MSTNISACSAPSILNVGYRLSKLQNPRKVKSSVEENVRVVRSPRCCHGHQSTPSHKHLPCVITTNAETSQSTTSGNDFEWSEEIFFCQSGCFFMLPKPANNLPSA